MRNLHVIARAICPVLAVAILGAPTLAQTASQAPTRTVITGEAPTDIDVWVPAGPSGSWPVVYAVPGGGGDSEELSVIAEQLASVGVLVFVSDHRPWDYPQALEEAACGYQIAVGVAPRYGGDLDQPVTVFGHSMGASIVLETGLRESVYGPGGTFETCGDGAQMPDVIVPLSGCHYEFDGSTYDLDTSGFANPTAHLALVVGTDDDVCAAWQSDQAADTLQSLGYDVAFTEIQGGDHLSVISQTDQGGSSLTPDPAEPDGSAVVQEILDAIDAARDS